MDFIDQIFKKMRDVKTEATKEYSEAIEEKQKSKRVCFNCGTEGEPQNKVKNKGGQLVCKKCLRKARKMAKKMMRGGSPQ